MFTGIIEEIGRIAGIEKKADSMVLTIEGKKVLENTIVGDSIATNGICLTVTFLGEKYFTADIMPETLFRTSLEKISAGTEVNLERALTLNKPLGGHMVQGHIDGMGILSSLEEKGNSLLMTLDAEPSLLKYIVEKGSVALDGTSLTVVEAKKTSFTVSLIPQTLEDTILYKKKIGDMINIECDILGKYVERLLSFPNTNTKENRITEEFLEKYGFL
ncbi:MAG: riboflavin synthase [Gallicola sp.]|nr:riboflavin synthase [Gallicola sp.]